MVYRRPRSTRFISNQRPALILFCFIGTDTKITELGYDNKGMSDIAMSPMDNASNSNYVACVD